MDERSIILVVDDEATHRAILFDYLDKQGYRVLLAEDGESAVEITKRIAPDVILLDIMLPGIDGYETCRRIKVHGQHRDVAVLFMSGLDDGATRSAIFKAGGNAHLLKPPVPNEVTALIEQNLEFQSAKRELEQMNQRHPKGRDELSQVVDFIAHDMKTPLLGTLGFAEELIDAFEEEATPDEWTGYAELIKGSALCLDAMLDGLVLLKNLASMPTPQPADVSIEDTFHNALERHKEREGSLPIMSEQSFDSDIVQTDPILFEELVLTILRIIHQLNPDAKDLKIKTTSDAFDPYTTLLKIDAATRPITTEEISRILEPITVQGRRKVMGTDISTVCAQKLIEALNLGTSIKPTTEGISIHLYLRSTQ